MNRIFLSSLCIGFVLGFSLPAQGGDLVPDKEEGGVLTIVSSGFVPVVECCLGLNVVSRDDGAFPRSPSNPPGIDPGLLEARKTAAAFSSSSPRGTEATLTGSSPAPNAPDVLERLPGLDILTEAQDGAWIPPDTQLAVGPGVYLEATNGGLLLGSRSGANPRTIGLARFFEQSPFSSVFDPKVFYDRFTRRFLVVAVAVGDSPRQSFLFFAVSASEKPAGFESDDWCLGAIDTKVGNTWGDYPGLGVNDTWTVMTVNGIDFDSGEFVQSNVFVIETAKLLGQVGCTGGSFARFEVVTDPSGDQAFTIQPAKHLSRNGLPGSPLYMVSSNHDEPSSDYTVWNVSGSSLSDVTLTAATVVTQGSYDAPPVAQQLAGPALDTGGQMITDAVYRAGRLWAVHSTGCALGDLPNESCIRVVEFAPTVAGVTSTFSQNMGNADWYYAWPAVAVNLDGDVVLAFQRSRGDRFLDVAFTGRPLGAERFEPPKSLQLGQCALFDLDGSGRNRMGDYVGLQIDPGDNRTFWLAGEYAKEVSVLGCSWGTAVGRVDYVDDVAAPAPRSPGILQPSSSGPDTGQAPGSPFAQGERPLGGTDDRPDRERPKIR